MYINDILNQYYVCNLPKKLADGADKASFLAANCKVLAFNDLLLIGLSTNSFKISSDFNAV